MASRNPSNWDEYERGGGGGDGSLSSSPTNRSVQFEEDSLLGRSVESGGPHERGEEGGEGYDGETPRLRRRRSSLTNRLVALTDIGGVNSIRSFKRSWQRAAGFAEVIPQRPSFRFAPDQEPLLGPARPDDIEALIGADAHTHAERAPLLLHHHEQQQQQHYYSEAPQSDHTEEEHEAADSVGGRPPLLFRVSSDSYRDREQKALEGELAHAFRIGSHGSYGSASAAGGGGGGGSIFAAPPRLATPPPIIVSASYGTVRSDGSGVGVGSGGIGGGGMSAAQADQAEALWCQQQEAGGNVPDGEMEPILVKEVEQDGKVVLTVEGQSTLPQTVFNSINVLIGIGLLSLPLGIKYAGWLCGMIALFLSAAVTAYTAGLLAKCMDLDASLITFSDVAFISFGRNARVATSILFTLELLAACVALVVLFADSMDGLFPGLLSVTGWKVLCTIVLVPLNFLPLRMLSFTSVLGILSCLSIVLILLFDGFIKPESPGSLLQPAQTYLFPANWLTLPLSFGLLMSPWGGHSVFPNIYRDMRHPHKYAKAVRVTFSFTYLLDLTTAVAGLLMFGDDVLDEITTNILRTTGYPRALTFLLCAFIALMPLTKIPLNARPVVTTAELLLGLHPHAVAEHSAALVGRSAYFRGFAKVAVRVAIVLCFLVISIVFPAFDSIIAFMGSALCFTICVTLPIAFYLKLFHDRISAREKTLAWCIMIISIILSIVGTVWAFLPKDLIGAA